MPNLPKIFIAYAREDAPLLDKLRKPLNVLKRTGHCEIFFDGEIVPGEHWDERLKAELHQADIYLLLVTDNFLDSDYINDVELPKVLEKEKEGTAKVVPIIMKRCMWQYTLLKEFQVVMYEGRPIEPSDGYVFAVEKVARVIQECNKLLKIELEPKELQYKKTFSLVEAFIRELEMEQMAVSRKEDARHRALDPFHDLMLPIKGGSFKMGGTHDVNIKDFHLCKHPVTQAQWRAIVGNDPSHFKGDKLPVEKVKWDDVQDFIKKLNDKTGVGYRLPSEAEWEFAARGGILSKGYDYAGSNDLEEVGWYSGNSSYKTHPVMTKNANEIGLYDMSGNIWEWCEDTWHESISGTPKDGSAAGTSVGDKSSRVVRGGSWNFHSSECRPTFRIRNHAEGRSSNVGFRLAR